MIFHAFLSFLRELGENVIFAETWKFFSLMIIKKSISNQRK